MDSSVTGDIELIFIFHKPFYYVVFNMKIIEQRNPDNNLESLCISGIVYSFWPV
jgi:hypothetical protein